MPASRRRAQARHARATVQAGLVLLLLAGAPPVRADTATAADRRPSAEKGLTVAREWCTGCHEVRRGKRRRPGGTAPSFQEVANRAATTAARLRRILRQPHNRMPTEPLYKDEIADLIAYIRSLKRRKRP